MQEQLVNQRLRNFFQPGLEISDNEVGAIRRLDNTSLGNLLTTVRSLILNKNFGQGQNSSSSTTSGLPIYSNSFSTQTPYCNSRINVCSSDQNYLNYQTVSPVTTPAPTNNSSSFLSSFTGNPSSILSILSISGMFRNSNTATNQYLPQIQNPSADTGKNSILSYLTSNRTPTPRTIQPNLQPLDPNFQIPEDIIDMCRQGYGIDASGSCVDVENLTSTVKLTAMQACTVARKRIPSQSQYRSAECNSRVG